MSQEQLQAFISQLQENKSMQAALNKATDYETVSLITQEAGLKATFEEPRMELTNQDLETIFLVLEPEGTPQPQFACQFCEAKFDRESCLYGHLNTHRNIVLTCEFCQQTFNTLKTYRKHIEANVFTVYCVAG